MASRRAAGRGPRSDRPMFDALVRHGRAFRQPDDGRRFLQIIVEEPDKIDMMFRLDSPHEHGHKRLREALSYRADAPFLRYSVAPFVRWLAEVPQGGLLTTCKAHLLQLVTNIPALLDRLTSELHGDELEPVSSFLLELLKTGNPEVRSREDVQSLAQRLIDGGAPKHERLRAMLFQPVGSAEAAEADDEQEPPGGRHDNDHTNFRQVRLMPTAEEILCDQEPFLPRPRPPNQVPAAAVLAVDAEEQAGVAAAPVALARPIRAAALARHVAAANDTFGIDELLEAPLINLSRAEPEQADDSAVDPEGQAALLERQFRLLREDMVGPMRSAVRKLLDRFDDNGQLAQHQRGDLLAFGDVAIEGARTKPRPCIDISVSLPRWHSASRLPDQKARQRYWRRGGKGDRLLGQDSMVALVRGGELWCFGRVVFRDEQNLVLSDEAGRARPCVGVSFAGVDFGHNSADVLQQLLPRVGQGVWRGLFLVQALNGLFAYAPVLKSLQRMDCVPLEREIVRLVPGPDTVEPLPYLGPLDVGAEIADLEAGDGFQYDDAQRAAMTAALCSRVSLTQGPPGTGKSFLGVRLADIIYRHTKEKILVMCYTNHSLDEFLVDLMARGVKDIVRIGGNCKVQQLKPLTIFEQSKKAENFSHSSGMKRQYAVMKQQTESSEGFLQRHLTAIKKCAVNSAAWAARVLPFLQARREDLLWQLDPAQYLQGEGDEWTMVGPHGRKLESNYLWRRWLKGVLLEPVEGSIVEVTDATGKDRDLVGLVGTVRKIIEGGMVVVDAKNDDRLLDRKQCQARLKMECVRVVHGDPQGAGLLREAVQLEADARRKRGEEFVDVWQMCLDERRELVDELQHAMVEDDVLGASQLIEDSEELQAKFMEVRRDSWCNVLRKARVIGCTTTGAAKEQDVLLTADARVVIVEEAGEVLEAHVLASLHPNTQHLILIGDHKQLRPKLEHFPLSVSAGGGHDFNQSLFERLIKAGLPHATLNLQHRMRPEISRLIRTQTYPDLLDGPGTLNREHLRGVAGDVVFVDHDVLEDAHRVRDAEPSMKSNAHEARMTCAVVKYLFQQGYSPAALVVLTPYVAQLHLLNQELEKQGPVLVGELDRAEMERSGLQTPGEPDADGHDDQPGPDGSCGGGARKGAARISVGSGQRQRTETASAACPAPAATATRQEAGIRVATVDNFQGEEADIVIISLVRCNQRNSIGFLKEPERVNVLLSRARIGMIVIGCREVFEGGSHVWQEVLQGFKVTQGFPAECPSHGPRSDRPPLSTPGDFARLAPCGGCDLLCTSVLPCGHQCPLRCHPYDQQHRHVECEATLENYCKRGHLLTLKCGKDPAQASCGTCQKQLQLDRKRDRKRKQLAEQERRQRDELNEKTQVHQDKLNELQQQIDALERQARERHERVQRDLDLKDRQQLLQRLRDNHEVDAAVREAAQLMAHEAAAVSRGLAEGQHRRGQVQEQLQALHGAKHEHSEELNKLERELAEAAGRLEQEKQQAQADYDRQQHELTARDSARRTSAEQQAKLLLDLHEQLQSGQHSTLPAVRRLLRDHPPDALRSCVRDPEIRQLVSQWARLDLSSSPTGQDSSGLSAAADGEEEQAVWGATFAAIEQLRPGLACLAQQQWQSAGKAFEQQVAIGGQLGTAAEHLSALCDVQQGLCAPPEPEDGPHVRLVEVLVHLMRALDTAAGRGSHRSKKAFSHALAVAAHPLVGGRRSSPLAEALGPIVLARLRELGEVVLTPVFDASAEERHPRRRQAQRAGGSAALNELVALTGLDAVKEHILAIKDQVEIDTLRAARSGASSHCTPQRNALFTGNPGTGKTTVARLYARMLKELQVLPAADVVETTGAKLSVDGPQGLQEHLDKLQAGGVLFIDEAYQLRPTSNAVGAQVLELLLTELEERRGELVVVLAGYKDDIEELLEHNQGLPSRFRITVDFPDFTDEELATILQQLVKHEEFHIEEDRFIRIAARRLGRRRGTRGFGNARAVRNLFEAAVESQGARLIAERGRGLHSDLWLLRREDLLGSRSVCVDDCEPWQQLQHMLGLTEVKDSVKRLLGMLQTNMVREDEERPVQEVCLNRIFMGNPGTGKTTVAKLYGQILKHLGLLSKGDVLVKNPSDFVGAALGESEQKTNQILDQSAGCVLVIDEAYGLKATVNPPDLYKAAVVDTLVARVQGAPGDDLCVLLLGYEREMEEFVRTANPGLARRFQSDNAFHFADYDDDALAQMLTSKVKARGMQVARAGLNAALAVLGKQRMKPRFGNGGAVDTLIGEAVQRAESRKSELDSHARARDALLLDVDFDPNVHADAGAELTSILDGLVATPAVRHKLQEMQDTITFAKRRGQDPKEHVDFVFAFVGPPGTGKTTVAKKMGQLFHALGLLPDNNVEMCSASDFSTGFLGQAGGKTRQLFERALGGVLFIDEAYRLCDPHSYGAEIVGEIVNLLTEDAFRKKLVVILAGYPEDIRTLLQMNQGLASRVTSTVQFTEFGIAETKELLHLELAKHDLELDPAASQNLPKMIDRLIAAPGWASGRDVHEWSTRVYKACAAAAATGNTTAHGGPKVLVTVDKLAQALHGLIEHKQTTALKATTEPSPLHSNAPAAAALPTSPELTLTTTTSTTEPTAEDPTVVHTHAAEDGRRDEGDEVQTALQEACVELGFDQDHDSRVALVAILDLVAQGKPFASVHEPILAAVRAKTKLSAEKCEALLRPQVLAVKRSMQAAVEHELRLRQELELLAAAERERERRREAAVQQQLRGLCPVGFAWHREGHGWCCNGGSHFVPDREL